MKTLTNKQIIILLLFSLIQVSLHFVFLQSTLWSKVVLLCWSVACFDRLDRPFSTAQAWINVRLRGLFGKCLRTFFILVIVWELIVGNAMRISHVFKGSNKQARDISAAVHSLLKPGWFWAFPGKFWTPPPLNLSRSKSLFFLCISSRISRNILIQNIRVGIWPPLIPLACTTGGRF